MQPFLGIPLSPCLSLWHHPRYKQHSYIQGHSLQGFFFFSSVLGGTGMVLFLFLPKVPLPPRETRFWIWKETSFYNIWYGGVCVCVCVCERERERERAQSCLTLCYPMDCGSSVRGILQARIVWWVAISSSRGSSWPRDWTHISCVGRQILYHWATLESRNWHTTLFKVYSIIIWFICVACWLPIKFI